MVLEWLCFEFICAITDFKYSRIGIGAVARGPRHDQQRGDSDSSDAGVNGDQRTCYLVVLSVSHESVAPTNYHTTPRVVDAGGFWCWECCVGNYCFYANTIDVDGSVNSGVDRGISIEWFRRFCGVTVVRVGITGDPTGTAQSATGFSEMGGRTVTHYRLRLGILGVV